MAGGPKLDGAGIAKLKTLDEAMLLLQRVHALVEQYALAMKRNQPGGPLVQTIRRTLPSLSENLKNQFGTISELVMSVNLAATRGASEAVRVRTLREGVAQIKQALEIAMKQTRDRHTSKDDRGQAPKDQGAS